MARAQGPRWIVVAVLIGALAAVATPARADFPASGSQMLNAAQFACVEHYGWQADSGTHSITIQYSIDCPSPHPILGRIELDEDEAQVVHVGTLNEADPHAFLSALSNPTTHIDQSVTFPFAKPGRVYTVTTVFATGSNTSVPPACTAVDTGGDNCKSVQAVTVPFTNDVVQDAAVAAPWSWTGSIQNDSGGLCPISVSAARTPDGGLTANGSTSCPAGATIHVYGDRRELVPVAVGSSQPAQYPDYTTTSEAQVPVVVPGHSYTVVYVIDGNTEGEGGSAQFVAVPPGCVLQGFKGYTGNYQGYSGYHCEIAANVTA